MSDYDDLKNILRELLTNRFMPRPNYVSGLLGDGQGNVQVDGKLDHSYVRFARGSQEFFEIFNRTITPVDNWPVLIGEFPWQPGLTQIVDTDWGAFEQSGWGNTIGQTSLHAHTHQWPDGSPGSDYMSTHMRSIVPLRGYTSGSGSTTVFVNAYEYEYLNTGTIWGGLPGLDLSPVMGAMVTGQARMMGVYLDPSTNSLGVVTGAIDVYTKAFDPPLVNFPSGKFPVCRVKLYGGQKWIREEDIRDARRLFSAGS